MNIIEVLEKVRKNGLDLKFVDEIYKKDKKIVIEAVK